MAGSEYLVMLRALNKDIEYPDNVSEEAKDFIEKCIATKPEDRYVFLW